MSWVCMGEECRFPARKFMSLGAINMHQGTRGGKPLPCNGADRQESGVGLPLSGSQVPGGGLKNYGFATWFARLHRSPDLVEDTDMIDSGPDEEPVAEHGVGDRASNLSSCKHPSANQAQAGPHVDRRAPFPPTSSPPVPPLPQARPAPEGASSGPQALPAAQASRWAWPTRLLRLLGTHLIHPPYHSARGECPPDSGPTAVNACVRRQRVPRLSPAEQAELDRLIKTDDPLAPLAVPAAGLSGYFDELDHDVLRARKAMKLSGNRTRESVISMVTDINFGEANANKVIQLFTDLGPDCCAPLLGFTNMVDLRRQLAKVAPKLSSTLSVPVCIAGHDGQPVPLLYRSGKPVLFAHHCLWHEALDMARDPLYKDHFVLSPQKAFNERGERVWSTFKGGLLFEEMQATAPPGYLVIAPILASDEATFLSRLSAYPVYCEFAPRLHLSAFFSVLQSASRSFFVLQSAVHFQVI